MNLLPPEQSFSPGGVVAGSGLGSGLGSGRGSGLGSGLGSGFRSGSGARVATSSRSFISTSSGMQSILVLTVQTGGFV